jgi:hypothetical protein
LGNQNKWWLRKPVIVATHKKPDEDTVVAVALLKAAVVRIEGYWFFGEGDETLPNQIEIKNLLFIDRGRRDFDHHGIKVKTSSQIVAEELGIADEKWLRPILEHVKKVDLLGMSEPFDLNDMIKSLARNIDEDEKIMELGIEIATAILAFHKEGMKRDNEKAAQIIKEAFEDEERMPEKIRRYYQLLQNPSFDRPCDFAELATVNPKLAREVLKFIVADVERYRKANEEVKLAEKIVILKRYIIIAGESDNPKFNVAARKTGAAIVIQKNKNGHVQIFFNNKILPRQVIEITSENLIEVLRLREISLDPPRKLTRMLKKDELRTAERIPEVPEWYFFKGEKGGRLILNGSLTAPDVPVTKIPLEEIVELTVDSLKSALENKKA